MIGHMSNVINMLAQSISPLKLVRARARVLAREDRRLRAELVRVRRQNSLSQKNVAELLGVTPQAIQKLERYDADPKLSTLRRYANAVGALVEHRVTVDYGQSISLASSSRWESNSTPGTEGQQWRFAAHTPAATPQPVHEAGWSAPKRSHYALGA